jgi:hypothetical protein
MPTIPELFRTYLDESEETTSGIYAVGGFVGKAADWEALEPEWVKALPPSVSCFHATDCFTGNKEFEEMDIPERVALLDHLTDLLVSRNLYLLAYGIDAAKYQQFAPKRLKNDFLGNKYAAPFGGIVEQACIVLGNSPGPEGVWKVLEEGENWEQSAFYIESNEYSASAARTISDIRKDPNLWWRHRIGREFYGQKVGTEGIPLLQVADLGAYLGTKQLAKVPESKISWKRYFEKFQTAKRVGPILWVDERSLKLLYKTLEDVKNDEPKGTTPWDAA